MTQKPFRKAGNTLLLSLALSTAFIGAFSAPSVHASDTAISAAAINYAQDWIVAPKAAYELIKQGALVLDARGADLKKSQGKLADAVAIVWEDLSEPNLPNKGRLIGDQAKLNQKLQSFGITKSRAIVVIADPVKGWGEDGRIAWTLRTLGHDKAVIVNGGLPALQKEGPLAIKPAVVPGDFVAAVTGKWDIKKEEIKDRLPKNDLVLLDVREPREYEGKTPYGESRGGHVPGAKPLFYKDLLGKDGALLPKADIERVLATKGVTKDKEIVSYCTGGIRSGWVTTVLNDLGYKARNYAGSMWEWSAQAASEYPLQK